MAATHTSPGARKAAYDMPPIWLTYAPTPMPIDSRYSTGSKKFGRMFSIQIRRYIEALRRHTATAWGTERLMPPPGWCRRDAGTRLRGWWAARPARAGSRGRAGAG